MTRSPLGLSRNALGSAQVALDEGWQTAGVATAFAGLGEKRLQVLPEERVEKRLLRLPPAIAQRRAGSTAMALPGRGDGLAGRRYPCQVRKRRAFDRGHPVAEGRGASGPVLASTTSTTCAALSKTSAILASNPWRWRRRW